MVESKALKTAFGWQNLTQKEWFPQAGLAPRQVERKWINSTWQDVYSIDYTYADGKFTEKHTQVNGSESATIRTIETIYSNKKKEKVTNYSFNNGVAFKISECLFHYTNQLLDSTILKSFSNSNDTTVYKSVYSYNADSTYKQLNIYRSGTNKQWVNENRTNWYYYVNTKLIRSLRYYSWNSKTNKWENDTKLEYEYNAEGNKTEEIASEWGIMVWKPTYRYSYTYDSNDKILKKEMFFPIYRAWRNTASINFVQANNSRNLTVESVYGFWGDKAGDKLTSHIAIPFNNETIVRNGHTITLTYAPFVGTKIPDTKNSELKFSIYPNPTSGLLYISNFDATNCSWTIYSTNGKVMKKSLSQSVTSIVDISEFQSGIYFITVASPNQQQTHKIVKY